MGKEMHRLNALLPHGASTVVESEGLLSSVMEGLRASVPAGNSKGVYDENLACKQFKSLVSVCFAVVPACLVLLAFVPAPSLLLQALFVHASSPHHPHPTPPYP